MIIGFSFYYIPSNQGLCKCYQPRPNTYTSTLIILDITKTSSNNCFKMGELQIRSYKLPLQSLYLPNGLFHHAAPSQTI